MIRFTDYKSLRPASVVKLDVKRFNSEGAAVDQFDAQDFNLNDCGFVRNDISQLMRAQSQAEYDMRLKALTEIPSKSLPDDMSIKDALGTIIPKYTQSPAELAYFAESLAHRDMMKLDDAYRVALGQQQQQQQQKQPQDVKTEPKAE